MENESLDTRLARLERALRNWRVAAVVVVSLMTVALAFVALRKPPAQPRIDDKALAAMLHAIQAFDPACSAPHADASPVQGEKFTNAVMTHVNEWLAVANKAGS